MRVKQSLLLKLVRQHGVYKRYAALFDMELVVFMGSEDIKDNKLNVFRMELLAQSVVGSLKEEAQRGLIGCS